MTHPQDTPDSQLDRGLGASPNESGRSLRAGLLPTAEPASAVSSPDGAAIPNAETAALVEHLRKVGPLYCGFCGKGEKEVAKLISGPVANVCDECVELFVDILAHEGRAVSPTWQPIETAPKPGAYIWLSDGFSMRIGFWADGAEFENHGTKGGGWRDMARLEAGGPGDLLFAPSYWQGLPDCPRNAIEARRDGTRSGPVEDESAVASAIRPDEAG